VCGIVRSMQTNEPVARKRALQLLGITGGGILLARCGGGGTTGTLPASAATATPVAGSTTSSCAVTPEGEIGPYFADDSAAGFNRSNILANIDGSSPQTGVPLTLSLTVRDAQKSCAAVAGAQVDIWHCNAAGVYSDEGVESTTGLTWLRGFQLTDANGAVAFTTIVPGWYAGRTTHIHLRVRSAYSQASSTSDGTNTTQLFFPQSLQDALSASVAPYDAHGTNSTTNASDRVYAQQTKGVTLLSLSGSVGSGYTAAFTIDLPITSG
jgi:protocatechuate 3,4-dioxygenase beta subunit